MSAGLPADGLRVVVDYMEAAERLRTAAAAVLAEADNTIQVRLGADAELRAVVGWPALEALRKALG